MASNEITGGGGGGGGGGKGERGDGVQLIFGRPTLALSFALVPQTLNCLVSVEVS